jgi:sugar phosphate permease
MNSTANKVIPETAAPARTGVFYGWYIVAATIVGIALGYSVVAVMAFGTFIVPLQDAFGWTRGQISLGVTVTGYTAIIVFPLVGALMDRIGARQVLIPSTILFGLAVGSLYFLTPSIWHFYAICILIPVLGAGTAPMTYSRLIVAWFDRRRGLALGIGLAGVGIGTALVPKIATAIMERYSWRESYVGLAILIFVVAVPLLALVMRNSPRDKGLLPDGDGLHEAHHETERKNWVVGFAARHALRQPVFWLIAASFVIVGLATSTVLIHMIPMMIDRGMTRAAAAGTFAYLGIAIILGRLLAGYLMDKFFAPRVVMLFMLAPVIGLAWLAMGATGVQAAVCAALVGMVIGAEFDAMAYLTSRYFGPRAFGQIYGYNYSAYKLGSATGPLIMGLAYDATGRYDGVLWAMAGILLLGSALMLLLKPFPALPREAITQA